jgi:Fe-S oxidoreductase
MELQKVERLARLCENCPKMCRHVCTTHAVTRSEADTPNERCSIAYRALRRGSFLPEEVPYMFEKCATCGLCLEWCETGIDAGEVMLAARADIVNASMAPKMAVALNENIVRQGNPHGMPAQDRFKAVASQIAGLPERAEVLYFGGCFTFYQQPEIALAAFKIFKAAQVNFTVLKEDEPCCGEPQRLVGYVEDFKATARVVVKRVRESGAQRVVYTCPSCLRMMREVYPQYGIEPPPGIEFLHITEFLQELLAAKMLDLRQDISKKVTYHDPCDLGRRLKVYEPPRAVLNSLPGVELKEMFFNRQNARCCGAGGGLAATNLNLMLKAGQTVVDLAQDVSAEILVTACPTCKTSFSCHTDRPDGLKTLDITELVAMAL